VLLTLTSGILLLLLFLFVEHRAADPILPLSLFRNAVFSVGASLSLLQSMMVLSLALYLPLFFQGVLALSPTGTGMVMTPFSLSMVAGAMLSGQIMGRLKRYRIIAIVSALVMSVGTLLIALMSPATGIVLALAILILTGIGIGPFFSLPMVVVQNVLPADQLGVSTAGLRYLGSLGSSLGIAIVGTIIASSTSLDMTKQLPATMATQQMLSTALQHGFLAVLAFALLALLASFFLKEVTLKSTSQDEEVTTKQSPQSSEKELTHA
jgi:MFS family permease